MYIQVAETPNPNTLKFFPGVHVTDHPMSYRGSEGAPSIVKALFSIEGVEEVFFGSDFISINKAQERNWHILKTLVVARIIEHLQSGEPILPEQSNDEKFDPLGDEIVRQIVELIETKVRPAVEADGGDIVFDRFDPETGIVYLKLRGACSGCPSATVTLKSGIESMLRHYVPEVTAVEQSE